MTDFCKYFSLPLFRYKFYFCGKNKKVCIVIIDMVFIVLEEN